MRTDAAADIRLDAVLENCIFYISTMYEFSHSLGHSRRFPDVRVTFAIMPIAAIISRCNNRSDKRPTMHLLVTPNHAYQFQLAD
jgi:hypothetical protein